MPKMSSSGFLGLAALLSACGGSATVPEPAAPPIEQRRFSSRTTFDFSQEADRSEFVEHDLTFLRAIGPYALFQVIGPEPRLEGPYVRFSEPKAYAMLCTAGGFMIEEGRASSTLRLSRVAEEGELDLIEVRLDGTSREGCMRAKDDYAERFDGAEGREEQVVVSADPGTPEGSTIFLRSASLLAPRGHNDSHTTPSVCCNDEGACALDEIPSGIPGL